MTWRRADGRLAAMILHRRFVVLLVVAVLAAGALLVQRASRSEAATTYQVAITGHDLQSLDGRVSPQLVPGSAGGVTSSEEEGKPSSGQVFFEGGVDLPAGAKITSVAVTMTDGDRTACLPQSVKFGSYDAPAG